MGRDHRLDGRGGGADRGQARGLAGDRLGQHAVVAGRFLARLVGSLITFVAVRTALTPADAEHRFGHGKAEALAGLAQAGFIAASGGGLLLTVGQRLLYPHPVHDEEIGLAISAAAIVLTLGLVAFQSHVVRRTGSIAISADRAHYMTDLVSKMAVGTAYSCRAG